MNQTTRPRLVIRNPQALTISSYTAMFFLGVSGALVGTAARNIGLTASQIGLLIAMQNIGFMISVSLSGALADRMPKPRLLVAGSLVLAFSLFAFFGTDLFWLNMLIIFLIGAGIGVYEGVTDAMLFDLHQQRVSFHINVNHFFVTIGSIVVAIYLIFLQDEWRIASIQAGIAVLGLSIVFWLARMQSKHRATGSYLDALRLLSRERVVISLFVAAILVVGLEAGSMGLLTTYLMDLRGFTQVTSKVGLVVFGLGIAAGRLAVGLLTRREHIRSVLLWLFVLAALAFTLLYFVNLGTFIYAAIFLSGAAISAILPLMITLAGLLYAQISGTVVGTIKIAIPLGGILIPAMLAFLAGMVSFQQSLIVFPLVALAGFLVLWVGLQRVRMEA
jgi:predicted MFS family arabinose efflux permease